MPSSKVPLLMRAPSRRVALEWALAFLGCMRHLVARPCIVLDIDGTLIINAPNGCSKCVLDFPALCAACTAHGIAIFCITARPEDPKNRAAAGEVPGRARDAHLYASLERRLWKV